MIADLNDCSKQASEAALTSRKSLVSNGVVVACAGAISKVR